MENSYGRQLSAEEIAAGRHRDYVGGLWHEMGVLQLDFLRSQGLEPHHMLLDMGCGALRGGVHFIPFLDPGHYCGVDINPSLVEAGRTELAGNERGARLLVSDGFDASAFGERFDFAIAVSLFTHLHANHIVRCLVEVRKVLRGTFYATFFIAPGRAHLAPLVHSPGGVRTYYDADPFHYSVAEIEHLASLAGLRTEVIGDWNHPRAQQMVRFRI